MSWNQNECCSLLLALNKSLLLSQYGLVVRDISNVLGGNVNIDRNMLHPAQFAALASRLSWSISFLSETCQTSLPFFIATYFSCKGTCLSLCNVWRGRRMHNWRSGWKQTRQLLRKPENLHLENGSATFLWSRGLACCQGVILENKQQSCLLA